MYKGVERRKFPRVPVNLMVSYRPEVISGQFDWTRTKNISQGGMLFTTKEAFKKGTYLRLSTNLPVEPHKIEEIAKVVDSVDSSLDEGLAKFYETRVYFLKLDRNSFQGLGELVKKRLGK
ncbi:MAG: PilZ domain-containing protein [Candidatus Omnitrophica bacterium]|nr:PilZ domain-containing protein [Candidatus Omnitrophota bacterium]